MRSTYIAASYLLFLIPVLLILNFFFDFVALGKIQGLPIFLPLLFSPVGLYFAVKADKIRKDAVIKCAIIGHGGLFLFPWAYMVLGTVLFGV